MMSQFSLVDAAFVFSAIVIALAAYRVAMAFGKWVNKQ